MTGADVAATFAAQRGVDPLVIDLARALSLATRIESELVRLMRIELFPESDAGLEANLWFSPLVAQRDALGLSLVPECRDELRRELMLPEHRATLQQAWRVIAGSHRPEGQPGIAPVLNVQEAVTYHALAAAAPALARAHRHAMQTELGTLIKALDDDADGALARWIARALPALPETARRSPAAIALAEKLRARDSSIVLEAVPHAAMDVSHPSPQWPIAGVDVGCLRRTDGIEFSVPPAEAAHRLKLTDTSPLALEMHTPTRDGWHTRSVTFERKPSVLVADPMPASRCRITTVTGQQIAVQPTFAAGRPTLAVLGLEGRDRAQRADIGVVATDLGWQLWIPGDEFPEGSGRADAVLILTPRAAAARYLQNAELASLLQGARSVLAVTPAGVEPLGSPEPATVLTHGEFVFDAEFSRDGSRIATAGSEGVLLWDSATGRRLISNSFGDVSRAATFSPDGGTVAIASNDGRLRMWRPDASETSVVEAHDDWIMAAEFSRSGRHVVTASQDHTAKLWFADTGLRLAAVIGHRAAVNHASFSFDESRVATASDDGKVVVSNVETGRVLAVLEHAAAVRSAVWSPDGERILTADEAGDAWLWSALTYEREALSFRHEHEIHFATFSADGRRIAVATADGRGRVWHLPSRALMGAPLRHAEPVPGPARKGPGGGAVRSRRYQGVYSVAFSPDGSRLLTGAADGRALMWDLVSQRAGHVQQEFITGDATELDVDDGLKGIHLQSLRAQLLALDESRLLAWTHSVAEIETRPTKVAADTPSAEDLGTTETGGRALIAFISDGIDVLHEAFHDVSGRSRIIAIWDQRDTTGPPPSGFDFGTLHTAERIAAYVSEGRVPDRLGRNADGAGTMDASIAAGGAVGEFKGGVAPAASILVVITRSEEPVGYSASHLSALSFAERMATALALPVVVHVAHGMQAGAHDGTSPLELAFDEFSKNGRAPGRVVVKSAGNDGNARQHAEITIPPDSADKLAWTCKADLWLGDRIELWWNSRNAFRTRLTEPNGLSSEWVDEDHPDITGRLGKTPYRLSLIRRHVDNGDSRLVVELGRRFTPIPPGVWSLEINGVHVVEEGPIHAWIERSGGARSEFLTHASESTTLSVPGTAHHVITVAAIESAVPFRIAEFSASGPTRDGREKPDVAAPGVRITSARGGTARDVWANSGATLAAARVSGAIALVLSRATKAGGAVPTADQIAQALRVTTANYSGRWDRRQGYGVVDVAKFIAALAPA